MWQCELCKNTNDDGDVRCRICGVARPKAAVPEKAQQGKIAETEKTSSGRREKSGREKSGPEKGGRNKLVPVVIALAAVLVLVLLAGVGAFYVKSKLDQQAEIDTIIEEAQVLADAEDFVGAIARIEDGIDEYSDEGKFQDKLDEYQISLTNQQITTVIANADALAANGAYEGAIELVEGCLADYPSNASLQGKLTEYNAVLSAQVKAQTLADAQALADIGEYESAMSMIKASQEVYGADEEYDIAYKTYHKAYSLAEANAYVDGGDYASAITLLSDAQKVNANDVDLISTYNTYCDSYVASVLSSADAFFEDRKIDEAIAEVTTALKVLPSNQTLQDKKDELQAAKPIAITSLNQLNAKYWTWNEETVEDPFGNDYSSCCNFFVKTNTTITPSYVEYRVYGNYSYLTGIIAPHADIGERYNGVVQVYADDVLVYTSPTVTQKTDAFNFEVDISGTEYIKIVITLNDMTFSTAYGKVFIADVQLWP